MCVYLLTVTGSVFSVEAILGKIRKNIKNFRLSWHM